MAVQWHHLIASIFYNCCALSCCALCTLQAASQAIAATRAGSNAVETLNATALLLQAAKVAQVVSQGVVPLALQLGAAAGAGNLLQAQAISLALLQNYTGMPS